MFLTFSQVLGSMLFRGFSSVTGADLGANCKHEIANDCKTLGEILYHVMVGDVQGYTYIYLLFLLLHLNCSP